MAKSKKIEIKNTDEVPSFAESISKIIVTDDTPPNMLAEWEKEYAIDCEVVAKLKKKVV